MTHPYAIGVAFTPQSNAVWDVGADFRRRTGIAAESVFITASAPLYWQRWNHVSESIEIWLDRDRLNRMSQDAGGPTTINFDYRDLFHDPIIVGIAARFRAALLGGYPQDAVQAEALADTLAAHFLHRYQGVRSIAKVPIRKLDRNALQLIDEHILANLDSALDLGTLSELVGMTRFHFARSFKATTGVPVYRFVTDRRMNRAAALLHTTDWTVRQVAESVGFSSMSHFLLQFSRAWGRRPSDLRGTKEPW